jgi:hypothetical protein
MYQFLAWMLVLVILYKQEVSYWIWILFILGTIVIVAGT